MCPTWQPILDIVEPIIEDQEIEPEEMLGKADAESEWAKKGGALASELYVQTQSYVNFKKNQFIYLFGLRGSGKTALINMISHEIRNKIYKDFSFCWIQNQDDIYTEIAGYIQDNFDLSNQTHHRLSAILRNQWIWLFKISAMQSVIHKCMSGKMDDDTKVIFDFLKKSKLIYDDNNREKFLDPLELINENMRKENLDADRGPKKLRHLLKVMIDENNEMFEDAEISLTKILKKKGPCLVMIDSMEYYDISDIICGAYASSLIEAVFDMYKKFLDEETILVKAIFPSETIENLIIRNKEKISPHIMHIFWNFGDLVSLVAKRYWYLKYKNTNIHENLNDLSVAKTFLSIDFPRYVKPYPNDLEVDTFFYIISNTHKKPRQVIRILNSILTFSKTISGNYLNIHKDNIIRGTNAQCYRFVDREGVLTVFENAYPNAHDIIIDALANQTQYFKYRDLDKLISDLHQPLERDKIKKLLANSSVIGKVERVYKYKEIFVHETTFEYQLHNKLAFNKDTTCAIHPMFYQFLHSVIDRRALVIPKPIETGEGMPEL